MIADRVAEFVAEKKRRKAAPTYEQYRVVLETILLPWCRDTGVSSPDELTDKVMDRFVDELHYRTYSKAGKHLSVATIRTYVRTVRIFLNWCGVPKGRFEMPHQPRRIVQTLTRQEIDLLERVADNDRDKLIVRVLADTGIRVGELLGLCLGDLRANTADRKYFIRVIGKGDKEREIGIPAQDFVRLRDYAKEAKGGFIFRTRTGTRLDRHSVSKLFKSLALKAHINRRVYAHLLRHGFVTDQIRAGKLSPIELQRVMGHTSLAMISQVYSHLTPDDVYDRQMAGLDYR